MAKNIFQQWIGAFKGISRLVPRDLTITDTAGTLLKALRKTGVDFMKTLTANKSLVEMPKKVTSLVEMPKEQTPKKLYVQPKGKDAGIKVIPSLKLPNPESAKKIEDQKQSEWSFGIFNEALRKTGSKQ
nr:uncharacterized protein LOC108083406 [Drosophila kikkawai]